MPVYTWRCKRGHEFDERQDTFAKDGDKKLCPKCGALATRTINARTTFRLMGAGWPSTDIGKTPGGSYGQ